MGRQLVGGTGHGPARCRAALLAALLVSIAAPASASAAGGGFVELERTGGPSGAPVFEVKTKRPVDRVRAHLNGRRIGAALETDDGRRHRVSPDADHGLRHGTNRLVVRAGGDSARATFRVRPTTPIAGAGEVHHLLENDLVELDGRASRAVSRSARLDFRWTIASAPDGAEPELRGASTRTPALIPREHGTYRVRLAVSERVGSNRARQADAATTADTVVVHVGPEAPPIGVPISTVLSPPQVDERGHQGIIIGEEFYPAAGADTKQCELKTAASGDWVQMLVLDRKSLDCSRQYLFNLSDASKLLPAVKGTNAGEIVVLTGGARLHGTLGSAGRDALKSTYKELGGTLRPLRTSGRDPDHGWEFGEFSLIGSRLTTGAAPEGSAVQSQSYPTTVPESQGSLDGYMQLNGELVYSFAFGQYVEFDSRAPDPPANGNVIRVARDTFESTQLAPGQSGFHVLTLDQQTLVPMDNDTFITNLASGAPNPSAGNGVAAMIESLNEIHSAEDPVTAIVQSIGHPHIGSADWAQRLAPAMRRIGATESLFSSLDGSHGYSLVGGTNLPVDDMKHDDNLHSGAAGFGQETSDQLSPGDPARLTGMLARNRQGQFTSSTAAHDGGFDNSIYSVAYETSEAGTPWPHSETPGEIGALEFIFRKLDRAQPFSDPFDLRDNYVLERDPTDWTNRLIALGQIAYPETRAPGFTPAEFAAVKAQLQKEFESVSQVRSMIDDYQATYVANEVPGLIDLEGVAKEVENDIDPPQSAHTSVNMQDIGEAIMIFGSSIINFLPIPAERQEVGGDDPASQASAALGAFVGIQELAMAFETVGGVTVTQQIEAEESKLKGELAKRFQATQDSFDLIGDILVSNWGALNAAGPKATQDWAMSKGAKDLLGHSVTGAAKQEYYGAFVPLAYSVYELFPQFGDEPQVTRANDYTCTSGANRTKIFETAPSMSQAPITRGWNDGKRVIRPQVLATGIDDVLDEGGRVIPGRIVRKYPPKQSLENMFASVADGGLVGLHQVTFFERAFKWQKVQCEQEI